VNRPEIEALPREFDAVEQGPELPVFRQRRESFLLPPESDERTPETEPRLAVERIDVERRTERALGGGEVAVARCATSFGSKELRIESDTCARSIQHGVGFGEAAQSLERVDLPQARQRITFGEKRNGPLVLAQAVERFRAFGVARRAATLRVGECPAVTVHGELPSHEPIPRLRSRILLDILPRRVDRLESRTPSPEIDGRGRRGISENERRENEGDPHGMRHPDAPTILVTRECTWTSALRSVVRQDSGARAGFEGRAGFSRRRVALTQRSGNRARGGGGSTMATIRCTAAWLVLALCPAISAAQNPGGDPTGHPDDGPGGHPTGPAGGSHGGPGDTVPGGTGSGGSGGIGGGGPSTPGPGQPFTPGGPSTGPPGSPVGIPPNVPTISIFDLGPDTATWEAWWSLNRDRYLAIKSRVYAGDAAVGSAPAGTGLARRQPDGRLVADRVLPILSTLVEREGDATLAAEALIALARADRGRGVDDALSERVVQRIEGALADEQLSVSEAALLALGARGSAHSIPLLAAIVLDSTAGRTALKRDSVPTKLRSIAALALGLTAARGRVDIQRYAAHALSTPLEARRGTPQDFAAACAAALGLLDLGSGVASDDLPASASASALARFLVGIADDPERDPLVRAQAAASAGRTGARTTDADRARAIAWAASAARDAARPTIVRQGAAIALGRLGRPTESAPDALVREALADLTRDTDRLVRGFGWLARAEIGARARIEPEKAAALAIQDGLLADFAEAKGSAMGFLALALGVLAHDSALVAAADGNRALKEAWPRARNPSDSAAIGLALGLRQDITASPAMLERFGREGDAAARSPLALGLGLAGATAMIDALRVASGIENHPVVIRDSAIARALLGDDTASIEMTALLARTKSLLAADYAADALVAMGDARSIEQLVDIARDPRESMGRRIRAVRALGGVADASVLPWNEPLRADGHFGAAFESWNVVVQR